jgi:hypothetical protein
VPIVVKLFILVILYYLDIVWTTSGQGRVALAQSRITRFKLEPRKGAQKNSVRSDFPNSYFHFVFSVFFVIQNLACELLPSDFPDPLCPISLLLCPPKKEKLGNWGLNLDRRRNWLTGEDCTPGVVPVRSVNFWVDPGKVRLLLL